MKFPDIPEAMTQGASYEQAYSMARGVLGIVLVDFLYYPKASSLEEIIQRYTDKLASLIELDLNEYRRKYDTKNSSH